MAVVTRDSAEAARSAPPDEPPAADTCSTTTLTANTRVFSSATAVWMVCTTVWAPEDVSTRMSVRAT